ncbi:hypothetical protein ACFL17_05340, partial [Pseudomonadota bacterium]
MNKFGATEIIAVTRAGWAEQSRSLFAGALEVYDTEQWGTSYTLPVGENTTNQQSMFQHTGLTVMATVNGTVVQIDRAGNGFVDGVDGDVQVTLDEGESYHFNGSPNPGNTGAGLLQGATLTATQPVQVDVETGDNCAFFESRWYAPFPDESLDNEYYTTTGTNAGDPAFVWLHNPGASSITITCEATAGFYIHLHRLG